MTINPNNKAIWQVILLFHLTDEVTEVTELDVCPYKLTVLFFVLLPLCFDPIFFSHGYGRPGTWLSQDFERYFSYLIFKRSYILKYTFDHHTMVEATDCARGVPMLTPCYKYFSSIGRGTQGEPADASGQL